MPYDSELPKIVKRLHEHETKTVPVIEKYKKLHGVERIDGRGEFDEVAARVSAVVERAFKHMR